MVEAAETAQSALFANGVTLAPIDILRIAADYAGRHAVLGTQIGTRGAIHDLSERLRKETLARVSYWEDYFPGGSRTITISKSPKRSLRKIELVDMMLSPPPKKRGGPRRG